jgi:hypothetical protein
LSHSYWHRGWESTRFCRMGTLWVLQSDARGACPTSDPSPATCWRRLKQWCQVEDVWLDASQCLLGALDGEGLLQWEEPFLDGSFAPAQK